MSFASSPAVSSSTEALVLSYLVFSGIVGQSIECTYDAAPSSFCHLQFVNCHTSLCGTIYLACPAQIASTYYYNCTSESYGNAIFLKSGEHQINGTTATSACTGPWSNVYGASEALYMHCTNISNCESTYYTAICLVGSHNAVILSTNIECCNSTHRAWLHSSARGYTTVFRDLNCINSYDRAAMFAMMFNKAVTTIDRFAFFGNSHGRLFYLGSGSITISNLVTDESSSAWTYATFDDTCAFGQVTPVAFGMDCMDYATSQFTAGCSLLTFHLVAAGLWLLVE